MFSLNDDGVKYVFYKEDGSKGAFDDIEAGSVLSFAENEDGDLVSVYISNKKVSGTLDECVYDGYYYLYKINGTYYKGNEYYNSYFVGDEGIFYFNCDNTLVYQQPVRNLNYAYLFKAETGNGGAVSVKMLRADGEWEVSALADEVTLYKGAPENSQTVNLTRLENSERLDEVFVLENGRITAAKKQLIHYKKNSDGKIYKIYMADAGYNKNYFSWDFSKTAAKYSEKNLRIGSLYVKEDTTVFCVDREKENSEDGYYVSNIKAVFNDGEEYNVNAYDTGTDGNYPAVIVTET